MSLCRHINPCLVLVQPRKNPPDITENLLTGTLKSVQMGYIPTIVSSSVNKKC